MIGTFNLNSSLSKRLSSSEVNRTVEHLEVRGEGLLGSYVSPDVVSDRATLPRQSIHFGILNCNGLSGKAELLEHVLVDNGLDLIFLSETWTGLGRASRLSKYICFPFEQTQKNGSRYSYGQCLMVNKNRLKVEDITMIGYDQTDDRSFQVFLIHGVLFCFVYFKPMESAHFITSKMEEIEALCSGDYPLVIAGDFNARSTQLGDTSSNAYGHRLVNEISRLGLKRVVHSGYPWTYEQDGRRSVVDHFLANEAALLASLHCENRDDIFLGSDHFLLTGQIDASILERENSPPLRPWNRMKLKDLHIKEMVSRCLDNSMDQISTLINSTLCDPTLENQARADICDSLVVDWLNNALETCVGRVSGNRRFAPFLTPDLQAHHIVVEASFARYRSLAFGSMEKLAAWRTYDENRKAFNKSVFERRNSLFKEFGKKLVDMNASEKTRIISSIRKARGRAKPGQLKNDEIGRAHV